MDWTLAAERVLSGSPIYIGAVLVAIAWTTRRSVLDSVARFGARLGKLEQSRSGDLERAHLEKVRRWQLEIALMDAGVRLPPWPDIDTHVPTPLSKHSDRSTR